MPGWASAGLLAVFGSSWLVEGAPRLCLHRLMVFSLCESVSKFPFFFHYKDTSHTRFRPTLMIPSKVIPPAMILFPNTVTL